MYVPFLHLPLFFVFTGCEFKAHYAHYEANSAVAQPQLLGDQYCTGGAPFAAYSAATTPDVSLNARVEEFLLTWMPLVGREPKFNHAHVSGRLGVAFRFPPIHFYHDTGFVSRVWRRRRIGC